MVHSIPVEEFLEIELDKIEDQIIYEKDEEKRSKLKSKKSIYEE